MDRTVPNKPVKQKRIAIYVSEEDYNKLQSKLRLVGKNVSEWMRGVIKAFLKENE